MANPRSTNGHRRRQLRKRVLAAYTNCAICGRPVNKTLHYLDPGAPEVDEIVPVSLGGDPLSWRNTRLVHRICNQRRGNRAPDRAPNPAPPATPVTSRRW